MMLSENLLRSISPPQTYFFSGLPFSGKGADTPQWSRLEISGSSLDHPHLPHLNKRKDTILPRRMIWGLSLPPISTPSSSYPVPWHRAPYSLSPSPSLFPVHPPPCICPRNPKARAQRYKRSASHPPCLEGANLPVIKAVKEINRVR